MAYTQKQITSPQGPRTTPIDEARLDITSPEAETATRYAHRQQIQQALEEALPFIVENTATDKRSQCHATMTRIIAELRHGPLRSMALGVIGVNRVIPTVISLLTSAQLELTDYTGTIVALYVISFVMPGALEPLVKHFSPLSTEQKEANQREIQRSQYDLFSGHTALAAIISLLIFSQTLNLGWLLPLQIIAGTETVNLMIGLANSTLKNESPLKKRLMQVSAFLNNSWVKGLADSAITMSFTVFFIYACINWHNAERLDDLSSAATTKLCFGVAAATVPFTFISTFTQPRNLETGLLEATRSSRTNIIYRELAMGFYNFFNALTLSLALSLNDIEKQVELNLITPLQAAQKEVTVFNDKKIAFLIAAIISMLFILLLLVLYMFYPTKAHTSYAVAWTNRLLNKVPDIEVESTCRKVLNRLQKGTAIIAGGVGGTLAQLIPAWVTRRIPYFEQPVVAPKNDLEIDLLTNTTDPFSDQS